MPIIVFEITEDDYVLFFHPESFRFFRQKVSPHLAYFFQEQLKQEIFVHSQSDQLLDLID